MPENPCSCKLCLPPPLPSLLGRAGISRAFLRLITFGSFFFFFYKASKMEFRGWVRYGNGDTKALTLPLGTL